MRVHAVSGWQGWGCRAFGAGSWGSRFLMSAHPGEPHPGEHLAFHSRPTSPRASRSWVEWGSKVSSFLPRVTIGRGAVTHYQC